MKEAFRWAWYTALDRVLRALSGVIGIAVIAGYVGFYLAQKDWPSVVINLAIVIWLIVINEKNLLRLKEQAHPYPHSWVCDKCDLFRVSSSSKTFVLKMKLDHMMKNHPETSVIYDQG